LPLVTGFVLCFATWSEAVAMSTREITIDKLCVFSHRTNTQITVDAPLFGNLMLLQGRVLNKGPSVEVEKIGNTIGFPPPEQIVAAASRFWILLPNGIRERKSRDQMAQLLEESLRGAATATAIKRVQT
jgi:hypothetical protein